MTLNRERLIRRAAWLGIAAVLATLVVILAFGLRAR